MEVSDGQPLPDSAIVARLSCTSSQPDNVSAASFELSSEDKTSLKKSLSVWESSLTPPHEAKIITGKDYDLALLLEVSKVRTLLVRSPILQGDNLPQNMDLALLPNCLDVVWDVDPRHGSEGLGHSGIVGLSRPDNIPRAHYKELRRQLAGLVRSVLRI